MAKLIDSLELPTGLRSLDVAALNQIASELRDELIDTVSDSGGHFASSLGATELTVALHHIFETPHDRLVWDVGHQGYIHKMLTGRRAQMGTIRKRHGISGYLRRCESEYDSFGAGHAGTSISAAVGMAVALGKIDPKRHVVAIIGDGSMTAGMAFEALNHAGDIEAKNLIVVLNDNEMSISPNVGAISWLFSRAITSRASTLARTGFKSLYKRGLVPDLVYKAIDRAEELTQSFISHPAMLFEAFGFRYIGPVDGHNIGGLITALTNAKNQDVPALVHVRTQKGRGYEPAENDPVKWHGVNPFDRTRGEFKAQSLSVKSPPTYSSVFGDTVVELAKQDSRIVGITAAMASGTGLEKLQNVLPDQFFDVGICEQHAVTFAAGLACEGFRPICAIYSTFLQRAYDQVIHDVCIQNLPVVFALDRAGAVGDDGETHQGVFDISYLRTIPNLIIISPKDELELRQMLISSIKYNRPVAIRFPKAKGRGVQKSLAKEEIEFGKGELIRKGSDALIISFGPLLSYALEAAELLLKMHNISCSIINARFAKPLDQELLSEEISKHRVVATLEDGALMGGFGSGVLEMASDLGLTLSNPILRFGIQDKFLPHGTQIEQHQINGYDPVSIVARIAAQCDLKPNSNLMPNNSAQNVPLKIVSGA